MIKAVIFDYAGVVRPPLKGWLNDIANAYGLPVEKIKEATKPLLELFGGGMITENQFWKQLSSVLNKPIPKNKKELLRKSYKEAFHLYAEIIILVKEIKKKGLKTAILSNTIKPHVEIAKSKKGYEDFDVVVLSCEVKLRKPEPEIYLIAVKKLKVKPTECIFIDNEEENLVPAKKLGMTVILAKNPKQVTKAVSKIIKEN